MIGTRVESFGDPAILAKSLKFIYESSPEQVEEILDDKSRREQLRDLLGLTFFHYCRQGQWVEQKLKEVPGSTEELRSAPSAATERFQPLPPSQGIADLPKQFLVAQGISIPDLDVLFGSELEDKLERRAELPSLGMDILVNAWILYTLTNPWEVGYFGIDGLTYRKTTNHWDQENRKVIAHQEYLAALPPTVRMKLLKREYTVEGHAGISTNNYHWVRQIDQFKSTPEVIPNRLYIYPSTNIEANWRNDVALRHDPFSNLVLNVMPATPSPEARISGFTTTRVYNFF